MLISHYPKHEDEEYTRQLARPNKILSSAVGRNKFSFGIVTKYLRMSSKFYHTYRRYGIMMKMSLMFRLFTENVRAHIQLMCVSCPTLLFLKRTNCFRFHMLKKRFLVRITFCLLIFSLTFFPGFSQKHFAYVLQKSQSSIIFLVQFVKVTRKFHKYSENKQHLKL